MNTIVLGYDELIEQIPDAVQRFLDINKDRDDIHESVRVYIGSTGSVAQVLNYFPSHPAKGDQTRAYISYWFVHDNDILHVYVREVSSGGPDGAGVRKLSGLFEVWLSRLPTLLDIITATSDGT